MIESGSRDNGEIGMQAASGHRPVEPTWESDSNKRKRALYEHHVRVRERGRGSNRPENGDERKEVVPIENYRKPSQRIKNAGWISSQQT